MSAGRARQLVRQGEREPNRAVVVRLYDGGEHSAHLCVHGVDAARSGSGEHHDRVAHLCPEIGCETLANDDAVRRIGRQTLAGDDLDRTRKQPFLDRIQPFPQKRQRGVTDAGEAAEVQAGRDGDDLRHGFKRRKLIAVLRKKVLVGIRETRFQIAGSKHAKMAELRVDNGFSAEPEGPFDESSGEHHGDYAGSDRADRHQRAARRSSDISPRKYQVGRQISHRMVADPRSGRRAIWPNSSNKGRSSFTVWLPHTAGETVLGDACSHSTRVRSGATASLQWRPEIGE